MESKIPEVWDCVPFPPPFTLTDPATHWGRLNVIGVAIPKPSVHGKVGWVRQQFKASFSPQTTWGGAQGETCRVSHLCSSTYLLKREWEGRECLLNMVYWELVKWKCQSCPTLCNPVDCSPPGSSLRVILQARVLEWVAISFSRGSSWPRDGTWVSRIAGRFFTVWATREAPRASGFLQKQFLPSGSLPRKGEVGDKTRQPELLTLLVYCCLVAKSCPTLLWPHVPGSSPGSFVQARILE